MKNLLYIILLLTLLIGCTNGVTGVYNEVKNGWTDEQCYQYYAPHKDIFSLLDKLKSDGYIYITIPYVFYERLDPRIQPNLTLANKGGNCAAWVHLFLEFINHKQCADEVFVYHMEKQEQFFNTGHLINIIRIGDKWYCQSNLDIAEYSSKDHILQMWAGFGYNTNVRCNRTWTKTK